MSKKEVVALLVVFILFVVIGGAVFMAVEGPQELETRAELVQLRRKFFDKLEELHHPNFTKREMVEMIRQLANARSRNLLDMSGRETNVNWNFYNSFFFAITVVTTIGYGHVSPSTVSGRLFCVAYAMIGVPLTGILLAAIGDHFSKHLVKRINAARKVYTSKIALAVNAATFLVPWLVVFLILPAGLFMYIEGWTYLEALYYCFISLATIGFGDYVAGNFEGDYIWIYKAAVVLWIIFGLGYLAMILNYISRAMRSKKVRRMEHRLSSSFQNTQQKLGARLDEMQKILQEFAVKQRKTRPSPRKCRSFGNMVEENERDGGYRLSGSRPGNRVTIVEHPSSEGSETGEIERLLTLVEVLKEESSQNLYRTKQLLEDTERDLLSFCREDSADSSRGVALTVPGTPNRRHSLPVLLTPSPPTSGDSLSGEIPGLVTALNFPSPRAEFAASPGNASLLGRSFQSFLYRKRPDILDLETGNRGSDESVRGVKRKFSGGSTAGLGGHRMTCGPVVDDDGELDTVQSSRM
ncbi:potassium channel subfamily K member 2-like [Galendromus occidentalis]|uniref:Potassium channel subfamily K member 2-like n=1 Tax=Galendromus occidentalis TaxID=34638 RepID=A0AAJ6VYY9_9ACAR|nr:potassium channel subfamily K member 2-like [Galendromus occidentalis]